MTKAILILINAFKDSICDGYRDENCEKCTFGRQSADYDWYCRIDNFIELLQYYEDKKARGEIK